MTIIKAPRIYRTQIGGSVRIGIEFDCEQELEQFLGARGIVLVDMSALRTAPALQTPKQIGRPCFDDLILAAIDELGSQLDRCESDREQAQLVRAHLGEDGPALRTIEAFIAAYRRPPNTGSVQKLVRKLRRA